MTYDSKDEDYGKPGYNRVKLNFVDDPHPNFAQQPPPKASSNDNDKGKKLDEEDKVHFALFVDKYLLEVPEKVRMNVTWQACTKCMIITRCLLISPLRRFVKW